MAERGSFERSSSEIATSPVLAPTVLPTNGHLESRESPEGREASKEPDRASLAYDSVVKSDVGSLETTVTKAYHIRLG